MEVYPQLATPKGRPLRLYTGDGSNTDKLLTFKQDGATINVSTWTVKARLKKFGRHSPDGDALTTEMTLTDSDAANGVLTLPISAEDITADPKQGAVLILWRSDTGKNQILGKYLVNLEDPGID